MKPDHKCCWVIQWVIEHVRCLAVDAVEQAREDVGSVVLVAFGGVVSLASPRIGMNWGRISKKPQRSQMVLEVAVESGGSCAVAVAEVAVVGNEGVACWCLRRWRGPVRWCGSWPRRLR